MLYTTSPMLIAATTQHSLSQFYHDEDESAGFDLPDEPCNTKPFLGLDSILPHQTQQASCRYSDLQSIFGKNTTEAYLDAVDAITQTPSCTPAPSPEVFLPYGNQESAHNQALLPAIKNADQQKQIPVLSAQEASARYDKLLSDATKEYTKEPRTLRKQARKPEPVASEPLIVKGSDDSKKNNLQAAAGPTQPSAGISIEPPQPAALHQAAINGNLHELEVLLDSGINPDSLNGAGNRLSPLLAIARESYNPERVACAKLLLERGASASLKDAGLKSVLNHAISHNNIALVSLLLEHGANPLQLEAGLCGNALHHAVRSEAWDCVRVIAQACPAAKQQRAPGFLGQIPYALLKNLKELNAALKMEIGLLLFIPKKRASTKK
jgi:hypothetical protein